jgi:hypothetical protein
VQERLQQLRAAIDQAVLRWHTVVAAYEERRSAATSHARHALATLRADIRSAGRDLQHAYARWKQTLGSTSVRGALPA